MTQSQMLTIPVSEELNEVVKRAAKMENRTVAGFVRHVISVRCQEHGLLNDEFEPIEEQEEHQA